MVTKASTAGPNMRALSFGAVSAFAPFVVVMYVDNPLVYVQYFGNLQFAILGICYGSLAVGGSHQWSLKLRSVNAALEVEEIPEPTEEGNSNAHPNRT
jgi:hypothetical protein